MEISGMPIFVTASAARQSMPQKIMDCHGLVASQ